jgi:CheY-like chemotaxis protein
MTSDGPKPSVLVVISDLLFQTKIRSTAATLGVDVHCVSTGHEAMAALDAHAPALMIVDLNSVGEAALEAIAIGVAHPRKPRVLAYVSHVDQELAEAATAAGADQVLPRSRFNAELPSILRNL